MPAPVPSSLARSMYRKTLNRKSIALISGVGVSLALALAGCSSDGQPAPTGSTGGARSTTAAGTDPNAGLKTGTELKASLLTKKDLPAGFKVSTNLTRDSADGFGPKSTPVTPTKAACKHLDTNVWINGAGIDSASFAQTGFTNSYGTEIDVEIDAYRGTDATKVMTNLRKLFTVCASYTTNTPGVGKSTVKVTRKAGPKAGDASVKAVLTSPVWEDGSTLIAVKVGESVVSVLYSSTKGAAGANAAKYAQTMADRLTAA